MAHVVPNADPMSALERAVITVTVCALLGLLFFAVFTRPYAASADFPAASSIEAERSATAPG